MGPLRLLLDIDTLYWWHRGDPALSSAAHAAVADGQNEEYVSAISAWEFITKFRSGKQPEFAAMALVLSFGCVCDGRLLFPSFMPRVHQMQHCCRGLLDRAAGHIDHRPTIPVA
jgi:hypothetical protein